MDKMSINFDTVEVVENVVTEWSRVITLTVTLDGVEETNQVTLNWQAWDCRYQLLGLSGWSSEAQEFFDRLSQDDFYRLDEVTQ